MMYCFKLVALVLVAVSVINTYGHANKLTNFINKYKPGYHAYKHPNIKATAGYRHDKYHDFYDRDAYGFYAYYDEDCTKQHNSVTYIIRRIKAELKLLQKQTECCSRKCPYGYEKVRGRCYRFSSEELSWYQAQRQCISENAQLVSIETEEEQQYLTKYIKYTKGKRRHYPLRYFTNGNELDKKGIWNWGTGRDAKPLNYSHWSAGEPNDHDGEPEECLQYNYGDGWNDVPCYLPFNYICEYDLNTPHRHDTTTTGTTSETSSEKLPRAKPSLGNTTPFSINSKVLRSKWASIHH